MSDTVPAGWDYKQLGDYVADSAAGEWGTEAQGDDNDIPVLRSTNFTESGVIDYTKLAFRNIEEKKRTKKALKKGDILLEKSGGSPTQPVGRVVYFDRDTPHLYSNFTQKLAPAKNCDSKYLFYKLYFEYQNGTVLKFQQQTTGIINFQLAEYLGFQTVFAPLPEQQKIAAILSSVDDVIEKTRAQIDKLKDLKTGMMQELLTKGIGSGGVPHTEFKDSPVGRVPASWKIVELGEIAKQVKPGPFGSSLTKAMYVEKGYKVYGQEQVISGDFRTGDYYIDEAKYDELAAFKVASGDILISLVGTFGQVAVVPATFEAGIINPRLLKIRFPSNIMDSQFIAQQLRSEFVLNQLKQLQQGGTMGVLSATTVKPVKLIVPPLDEQKMIGNSVHAIDMAVSTKLEKLRSTQNLKKALMQDLLTGKVRVKVDQKESAVA